MCYRHVAGEHFFAQYVVTYISEISTARFTAEKPRKAFPKICFTMMFSVKTDFCC